MQNTVDSTIMGHIGINRVYIGFDLPAPLERFHAFKTPERLGFPKTTLWSLVGTGTENGSI